MAYCFHGKLRMEYSHGVYLDLPEGHSRKLYCCTTSLSIHTDIASISTLKTPTEPADDNAMRIVLVLRFGKMPQNEWRRFENMWYKTNPKAAHTKTPKTPNAAVTKTPKADEVTKTPKSTRKPKRKGAPTKTPTTPNTKHKSDATVASVSSTRSSTWVEQEPLYLTGPDLWVYTTMEMVSTGVVARHGQMCTLQRADLRVPCDILVLLPVCKTTNFKRARGLLVVTREVRML